MRKWREIRRRLIFIEDIWDGWNLDATLRPKSCTDSIEQQRDGEEGPRWQNSTQGRDGRARHKAGDGRGGGIRMKVPENDS